MEAVVKTLAIHFARLGPYHLARLESAAEVLGPMGWRIVALETAGSDDTYAWEKTEVGGAAFERKTVFPDRVFEKIPAGELRRGINAALEAMQPNAMAVAGWGTVDARACLAWCRRRRAKVFVMSETREADGRRVWWREWVKSRVVRKFDGALCGGMSHIRYLERLGLPRERIAMGYNVVDNAFFSQPGQLVRSECPFFLASNRFVERKNLQALVEAQARCFASDPKKSWPLVLLGNGILKERLMARCQESGLDAVDFSETAMEAVRIPAGPSVVFAGFRQIHELPSFYAAAGAFVHPALEEPWGLVVNEAMAAGLPVLSSRNVGAAEELVEEGVTGFLFEPQSVDDIARAMTRVVSLDSSERCKMSAAARVMVEQKTPKRAFGEGLARLLEISTSGN
ncbi:MAG: glycosyltransferase family 4 protein [Verrucomicrobiota bacterium]